MTITTAYGKDYVTRTREEAETHRLFGEYLAKDENWSSIAVGVQGAFRAMYTASLPVGKITRLMNVMFGQEFTDDQVQVTLTKLCRAKVLRSRMIGGMRYYEVNY